jgi:hypothetical protein
MNRNLFRFSRETVAFHNSSYTERGHRQECEGEAVTMFPLARLRREIEPVWSLRLVWLKIP